MPAGDTLLMYLILFWLSIGVGPWWLGLVGFFGSYVINLVHHYMLVRKKVDEMEKMAKAMNISIPPAIAETIKKLRGRKLWDLRQL